MKIITSKSGNGSLMLGGGMKFDSMSCDEVKKYFDHDTFVKEYLYHKKPIEEQIADGCVLISEKFGNGNRETTYTVVEIDYQSFKEFLINVQKSHEYGENELLVDFSHVKFIT